MPAKTALLIDFDNVFISLWSMNREAAKRFASEPEEWLQVLANAHLTGESRRWLIARCYLNPAGFVNVADGRSERLYFSRFRPGLVRAGLEVVDCPAVTRQGKNAADIRMVLDVVDLLNHRTRFDEFVIASGDADFTPLLQRLRAEDRRIVVLSPGYLSAAYTAIADRVIDLDGITAILDGDAEGSASEPSEAAAARPASADGTTDDEARFAEFIRRRYDEATGPLSFTALALEAGRLCPSAKRTHWFGNRSFLAAVVALRLPNVRTSNHHLWNDERHQPPGGYTPGFAVAPPETVALLMRALDLPRIERKDWPLLFRTLAVYMAKHAFDFGEATRWTRDHLAEDHGATVARGSIAYVLRGCQFGGARLDAEGPHTEVQLGRAFFNALLDRASALSIQLTADDEETIADWLGLEGAE